MRIGSRRNVCAITLPGEIGADRPSPIGSSIAWCVGSASAAFAALLAAPIAFARCRSPAIRTRWRTISTSDSQTGRRPVSAARDHFMRWLFCVAAWYRTVPDAGSTSAMQPRVFIGWFE